MYEVVKQIRFEAAHKLPEHDGKCARLHGHSFVADIVLRRQRLMVGGPKDGMLVDFGDIKAACATLLNEVLDHQYLNETTGLDSPTSEQLARFIFDHLAPRLPSLYAVTVHETCTSRATYWHQL